jgi:signal transduction histidine kinase
VGAEPALAGAVADALDELLVVVLGYTALAERSLDRDALAPADLQVVQADLQVVQAAAERVRALAGHLHAIGRHQPAPSRPLELGAAVVDRYGPSDGAAGLRPVLDLPDWPEVWVSIDPHLLGHLIEELVVNGVEALDGAGAPGLALERSHLADGTDAAAIVVCDHGRGMDAEVIARCREPLFTTKPPGRGAGLGLTVVEAAVAAAGGELDLCSSPGEGTVARVLLPEVPPAATRGEADRPLRGRSGSPSRAPSGPSGGAADRVRSSDGPGARAR